MGPWALASAKKCPIHDERLIPLAHQIVKDVILIIRHMGMDQYPLIEGSLEVKLPTIWTDEKQSRAEAERRERLEERRSEEKESEERRCRCAKR